MGGLVPKEAQYGDHTALRRMGVKETPTGGIKTFNPQGGRPPKAGAQPAPGLGGAPPIPPGRDVPETQSQQLYDRSTRLAGAARIWLRLAESYPEDPDIQRIALALKEAARLAILDARENSPWLKGM